MKHVVKDHVCLDILLMGSVYVITSTLFERNTDSRSKRSLRVPPRAHWLSHTFFKGDFMSQCCGNMVSVLHAHWITVVQYKMELIQ